MPTCQGHTQTTDAQLSHAQIGPHGHIRSEHNEDVGLYSRRDELQDPNLSRERSMERPGSSSRVALNMAPNSSRGTSMERLAESSSRIAQLKLPKPVGSKIASSAPLFDAYSESSRLDDDDDDIQGTNLRKLGLNSCRRDSLNFYYFAGTVIDAITRHFFWSSFFVWSPPWLYASSVKTRHFKYVLILNITIRILSKQAT